jgi:hypothetical protein
MPSFTPLTKELSTGMLVLTILSLAVSALLIAGIIHLLMKKTRGETKKLYQWMLILSICYLIFASGTKTCYTSAPIELCGSMFLLGLFSVGILADIFVAYYVFCYSRLLSILKGMHAIALISVGSAEQRFWSGFNIALTILTILAFFLQPIIFVILYNGVYEDELSARNLLWLVSLLIWGMF